MMGQKSLLLQFALVALGFLAFLGGAVAQVFETCKAPRLEEIAAHSPTSRWRVSGEGLA
jgi:hypothetical protein